MHRVFNFKDFYLKETDAQRQREGRIKMLVYGQNFIFFFRYSGDIYGGGEDARLTYATMKSDEEEGTEEMVFQAANLTAAMEGKPHEEFFRAEDVNDIEVIPNNEAEDALKGRNEFDKDVE